MALNATVHACQVVLNDADRGVYETLDFRMARHPSESAEFLSARLLAYCLEYREGLEFSAGGLSDPDSPALVVRDLTGRLTRWIEVGLPEPPRLHRAMKAAGSVAVYAHKDPTGLLARLAAARVHRAQDLELWVLDPQLIGSLAGRLDRRVRLDVAVAGGSVYVTVDGQTFEGEARRVGIAG